MFVKNKKQYKAFSLVELFVVISIIAIMTSATFVSLQSSRGDSRIKAAQNEVTAVIRLAQSYALQGKTQIVGGANIAPCSYGFEFVSSTEYRIFYKPPHSSTVCSPAADKVLAETFSLKEGVTIFDFASAPVVNFAVPFGNVTGAGIFTLQYPDTTGRQVIMSSNGNVIEN